MKCPRCPAQCREIEQTSRRTKYYCPACRNMFYVDKSKEPLPPKNSYMCFNHQDKAKLLVNALAPKWNLDMESSKNRRANFVLTDNDAKAGRRSQLSSIKNSGCNLFFVYPHTARPSMINDRWPAWEGTTAQFVVNQYHAEALRGYGYEKPIHEIGWSLCPIREFQPKERAQNVLFAPIHPRNAEIDRKVNSEAFDRLYQCVLRDGINLTVRYVGDLENNGLTEMPNVKYVNGKMDQSFSEIDAADVVIGHQTVAWIAVARGVSTLMMAEDMPTHFKENDGSYSFVKSWDKVKHIFQYPLDILEESDTIAMLNRAARSDIEIRDWKRRMIGDAFCPDRFISTIENYL